MERRSFLLAVGAGLLGAVAGCVELGGEQERPEPTVREVRVPEPTLPEHDPLSPEPVGGAGATVSEPVRNEGEAGRVHVTVTALESSGASGGSAGSGTSGGDDGVQAGLGSGSGVSTGGAQSSRVATVTLAAGETRTVAIDDVPGGDGERYVVEAYPGSATAVVHNDGPAGRVVVELESVDGEEALARRTIRMSADETREVTFTDHAIQLSGDDLGARARPADSTRD